MSSVISNWLRWGLGAALAASAVSSCGTERDQVFLQVPLAAEEPAVELGRLHLALETETPTRYQLRAAVFTIVNQARSRTVTLRSEDEAPATSLESDLLQDSYEITLGGGWSLHRLNADGSAAPVRAALITANPTQFDILHGQLKELAYTFATDEGVVTFGRGTVSVSVGVVSPAVLDSCNLLDRSSCPAGQTCLLADQQGRTFCAAPGTLPAGSPCSTEQCVTGSQCLQVDGEGGGADAGAPSGSVCARFCNPRSNFCGCQALSFSPGVGICTEALSGAQFSHAFQSNVGSEQACEDWRAFKSTLALQTATRLRFSNNLGSSFECNDPATARRICNALSPGQPFGSLQVQCDGHTWTVQDCTGNGMDLAVDGSVCGCNFDARGASLRPCSGASWGGFGESCFGPPPSQTLEVLCDERPAAPRCGDGRINQPSEQCDGAALPSGTPFGTTCSPSCSLLAPPSQCRSCVEQNCADHRAIVDANQAATEPLLACVLGADWRAGNRAPASSCGNRDLLTCFCGNLPGSDCVSRSASDVPGPCAREIAAGTGCVLAACVAPVFLNPANVSGKALQYVQCQQDFCFEECFTPF